MKKGIGGHTKPNAGESDDWLTPPHVLAAVGPFDLDPCATGQGFAWRPWDTAARSYTEGGLERPWDGLVWLNPPYGSATWPWLSRLAAHPGGGVALTFARTETDGFFAQAWDKALGLYFIRGRLYFHRPNGERADGNAGGPSVLLGYTEEAVRRLAHAKERGLDGHLTLSAAMILRHDDGRPAGSWREAVLAAMAGRPLTMDAIYAAAEGTAKVRLAKEAGHNWRAQLRRTLQRHFQPLTRGAWAPA